MAVYKIKDIEVLTGIKAHTIRIWEKRYGILVPSRSETQIRTYSDKELAFLLNISLLNKSGHKISKIAKLENEEISKLVWNLKYSSSDNSDDKLILALVELDETLFRDTLAILIKENGLELTFTNFIIPFLDRIGIMWLIGTINPAQEHFITNLIRQKVIGEIDKLPIPDTKKDAVMLYLPEHEWHELSLLFYQFILRKKDVNTIYLGQSLPYDALMECIEKLKPKALMTSLLSSTDENFIENYFKNIEKDTNGIPVFAGGAQVMNYELKLPKTVKVIKSYLDLENCMKSFIENSSTN
jgi:DNA-binding transcriptional MerR regulator